MSNEKIEPNMSVLDVMMTMSEGNPGALMVLMKMMEDPIGFLDMLLCDSLDIRGTKLYMLDNDCCGRNYDKLKRTLTMFRCGAFSEEEIHNNLNLVRAIPFIDDGVVIKGIPEYGKEFGPGHPQWDEYCLINRRLFIERLNSAMEQESAPGLH